MLTKNCIVCGTKYTKKITCSLKDWNNSKYCSRKCINSGRIPWNRRTDFETVCPHCGNEFRKRNFDDKYCSQKCARAKQVRTSESGKKSAETRKRRGYIHSPETRAKLREAFLGEKSHWWKGGKSAIAHRLRESAEMKEWKKSVFKRDDWTCQECKQRGGKLIAHHLKAFAYHPELRFDVNNGQTLCIECHKQTENYGKH